MVTRRDWWPDCQWCGEAFDPYLPHRRADRVYCSARCAWAAYNHRRRARRFDKWGTCPWCGLMFHRLAFHRRADRVYCCRACQTAAYAAARRNQPPRVVP